MPTPAELQWQTMTATLSELRTPNSFLTTMLFSRHNTNPTSIINIDAWVGGRRMAPFVTPGSAARMVPGRTKKFSTIEAPNIRIKRPFSADQMVLSRTPGSPIFIGAQQIGNEIQAAIAGDVRYMREQIDDTIEWMAAQVITGVMTYNITDTNGSQGDAFTIDYGRPAGHTITLATTDQWDEPAATSTKPISQLITEIDRLVNALTGLNVDKCVMGKSAADLFLKNEQVRKDLDVKNISPGAIILGGRFSNNGAKYLGTLYGVEFWEYSRTVLDEFGNTVSLIGDLKAHFFSSSPLAENVLEFGAIVDASAMNGRPMMTEVFSKSWMENDPSGWTYLATSRPLPVTRRPECFVSVTVA